jgi:hypothetical protein
MLALAKCVSQTVLPANDDDETPVTELLAVVHALHRQWRARSFSPVEGLHVNGLEVSHDSSPVWCFCEVVGDWGKIVRESVSETALNVEA